MAQIKWQSLFETGNEPIDQQHQELVRILNRLEAVITSNEVDTVVEATLHDLVTYTDNHFQYEEAYMRKIEFPGVVDHEAAHRRLVGRVNDLVRRREAEIAVTAQEVLSMLTDWLLDHLVVEDKKYARWAEVALAE